MADITRRRQGELLQGIFAVLESQPDGLPAREVIARVRQLVPPTPFEAASYPNAPESVRYDKIVRFLTIAPAKAGWLIKNKGSWSATPEGLEAKNKFPDAEELFREAGRLYNEWRKTLPQHEVEIGVSQSEAPEPTVTLEEAEETARDEIRQYLAAMPPYDMQELIANLLRAMGYHVAWIAPPGPDRGVDIIAYTDPLGAVGPRIKVQVKRRADKIPVQEVRAFVAVLGVSDVGIFASLAGFTAESQNEARGQESRRLTLLGADDIVDLWVEHYGNLPETARQLLPLKPIYYLATPT